MMRLKIITMALMILASTASSSFADHERFIVGEMRNIDPSEKMITSTSGSCIPSHDRERLECYFTTFGLWKVKTEEEVRKDIEQAAQEMNKDSAKTVKELMKSFCGNKKMPEPDPMLLKYNVGYKMSLASRPRPWD